MTDQDNPYAAPQASALSRPLAADPGNARLRAEPAKLAAGRGAEWVSLSWQMFRKAPGVLVAMMLLYFVLAILAGLIPVIGDLFMSLAFGLWMAGWAITMDKLHRGADVSVGDLFAGFSSPRAGSLFMVRFAAPEFTSLCPVTGQPDFAHLVIDYAPGETIVESKSLKLFLGSFRNHAGFHEDVTVGIGQRLFTETLSKTRSFGTMV